MQSDCIQEDRRSSPTVTPFFEQVVIMSAKFKSTKKKQELEAEIDDWDASEEEEQQQPQPQSISQAQHQQSHHTKVYQDAWGDDDSSTGRPKVEGRTLWEEA